ncbi:hypothetical protein QR46_4124 [Giardia duodenalis assemblage B]|uniref:Uncharacterized protein n=1 Tax=Giardia duodenalis assemblage B TaxID=1394984 RepID=A0A132NP84_GIAIN|nr:hypothetical protein QR46_4124 [Giardia intestinalis assemblage B]
MNPSIVAPESDVDHMIIIADNLVKLSSHIYNVLIRRVSILYPTPIGILHIWPRPVHKRISALLYRALKVFHSLTFKIQLLTDSTLLESLFDLSIGVTRAPRHPPDPDRQIETVLQNTILCGIYQFFTICVKRLSHQVERCLREGVDFKSFTVIATAGGKRVFPVQTTILTSKKQQQTDVPGRSIVSQRPSRREILFTKSLVFYEPRLSISFLLHWC